ncbi:putative cytidine deaminase [Megavirus vitis]|nr:putative cytidine deaminase [Megavirus vitis]
MKIQLVIAPPCFVGKACRALNVLSTGINHQNYHPKKKEKDQEKNNMKKISDQYSSQKSHVCKHRRFLSYADKSTHAEEMALDKLKKNRSKRIIDVSLIVIRITPSSTPDSYKLANSRPCIGCIHKIKNSFNYGVRINKIYFSNENGEIICYKLRDILSEKQHLSKYHRMSMIPKKYTNEFQIMSYTKCIPNNESN